MLSFEILTNAFSDISSGILPHHRQGIGQNQIDHIQGEMIFKKQSNQTQSLSFKSEKRNKKEKKNQSLSFNCNLKIYLKGNWVFQLT